MLHVFRGQNVAKSFAEHCGLLRVNERFLRPCQFSTANACLRNWLGHPSHPNPHPKKRRRGPRSSHETLARVPEELGEGISKHLQMKGFCLSQLSGLYSFFVWLVLSKRCNQPVLCFFLWFCFLRNSMENGDAMEWWWEIHEWIDCIEWVLLWLNI